jgi:hypothetical protein
VFIIPHMSGEFEGWRKKPDTERIVRGIVTSKMRITINSISDPRFEDSVDTSLPLKESIANSKLGQFVGKIRRALAERPS